MIVVGTVILNRARYILLFGQDDFDPPLTVRKEIPNVPDRSFETITYETIYDEDLINKVCRAVWHRML